MDDYHVSTVGGGDAFAKFQIADVKGISHLQVGDIDLDGFGKISGHALDLERVDILLDHAACFGTGGFAVELDGDVGGDGGFAVNRAEVGMQGGTSEGIVLHGLKKGEACAFSCDFKVYDDVFRRAVGEDFAEGLGIHFQVFVIGAFAVDDGWQPAFAAHLIKSAGAGAGAKFSFDSGLFGHDGKALEFGINV